MADWNTVRYDPSYEEKLDEEIIPLCDSLNAMGFETVQSCWGHGCSNPRVWFTHPSDERVELLARFIMGQERDFCPFCCTFSKIILLCGHQWRLEIHFNNVFSNTPQQEFEEAARAALDSVNQSVNAFYKQEKTQQ